MPVAATAAYVDVTEYRKAIDKHDSGDDQDIERDLLAISRWLDRRLDRFFGQEGTIAAPVSYSYDIPAWEYPIAIDDFVSVSAVKLDLDGDGTWETTLTTSQYRLLPKNAALGS